MVFRAHIQDGMMINNDPVVLFTEFLITPEAWVTFREQNRDVRLVFSRPVFDIEIDAGLNVKYEGRLYDEKPPKITRALDDLYQLFNQIKCKVDIGIKPHDALVEAIAYNFYDCLSGGAGTHYLAMCRLLIEKYGVTMDREVYPGEGDKWSTIADFLKEIEHIPRIEKSLPSPVLVKALEAIPK